MSRSSKTDQLADLRRIYTGENLSQAVPAVRSGTPLPKAPTQAQEELEARLLVAASTASGYLQFRPPASVIRPANVFTAVEPVDAVRLHLAPHALGPLLYEVLPRTEEGYPMGIAGLTHVRHRRSAELKLGNASAVLSGVDAAAWEQGMRWVHWMIGHRGLDTTLGAAAESPDMPNPATGSALLRRINLLGQACWFRVLPARQWVLDWAGGPSVETVSRALEHPVFGSGVSVVLQRQEAPAVDIDPDLRTWPWPEEFVSPVTAAGPVSEA